MPWHNVGAIELERHKLSALALDAVRVVRSLFNPEYFR
jgi:hypothetical protein